MLNLKTPVYVIYATTAVEGIVLLEVFTDLDKALTFEKDDVDAQLRRNYGDKMADCESLQIGMSTTEVRE